jgi:hypothetical protein
MYIRDMIIYEMVRALFYRLLDIQETVEEFLRNNVDFLEDYITKCVDKETVERWALQHVQSEEEKAAFVTRWKLASPERRRLIPHNLTVSLGTNTAEGEMICPSPYTP